jgi:hypothetical protein
MENDRPLEVVGVFMSLTATFESIINGIIEYVSFDQKITDFMQKQAMDMRIRFIKHNISLIKDVYYTYDSNLFNSAINTYHSIIAKLDGIMKCHNEYEGCRNLVAHSPLHLFGEDMQLKNYVIMSSCRYKPQGKNNLIKIAKLKELNEKLRHDLADFYDVINCTLDFCAPILEEREKRNFRE